jgi:nucleoside-diphosphate-sugar epimerase
LPILITGATGFLGSRLLARLASAGAHCFAVARTARPVSAGVTFVQADLRQPEEAAAAVRSIRPRWIFHCAMTPGHPNTSQERLAALQTSVLGTAALAEAAAECGVQRFVFTGSFLVYRRHHGALAETSPIEPHTFRGAAKAGAALWLQQFARAAGLPAVELRIFSIYGPGEPSRRFIPSLLRAAREGTALPLLPGPSHDFVHVDDVVDAALLAANTPVAPGSVYNITGGRAWRNEEVVEAAARTLRRTIPVDRDGYSPSPADAPFWLADISAAEAGLGWKPAYSLEDGLRQTYEESWPS